MLRSSWLVPRTTTVALADGSVDEPSSITRRPVALVGDHAMGTGRCRLCATGVSGGVVDPTIRSRVRVRRRLTDSTTTGSVDSTKEVCGVLWAIGPTPSMLVSKTIELMFCIGLPVRYRSCSVIEDVKCCIT